MPPTRATGVFQFGEYKLDPVRQELLKYDRPIKLQPLHFTLLLALVENHDRLVTREELRQRLWGPDTFVDFETGLNHCIRVLRATLSDDAQTPRFIETVPKRGYRFIAPVESPSGTNTAYVAEDTSSPEIDRTASRSRKGLGMALAIGIVLVATAGWLLYQKWATPVSSQKIVVIVLPFANLSGDPNQEYLSQGVTEEMIAYLGRINPQRIAVIGRTSAIRYAASGKDLKQIKRETGADYVVEGSVRRLGTHVRITAQLTRSRDQTSLWTDSFDGEFSPETVIAMQSQFVNDAGNLMTKVLRVNPVSARQTNPAAYDAFLKGRYYWNRRSLEGFQKAIENFDVAIQNDPKYAPAYAGKADALSLFLEYYEKGVPPNAREEAFAAARTALALDDSLPEAHTSLAFLEWRYHRNFVAAENEFRRSIELDPNSSNAHHWYGLYLASRGRFPEAKLELENARRFDPLSLVILTNIGWVSYFERDFDSAVQQYRAVEEMDPTFQPAHVKIVWVYQQQKRWQEAMQEQRRLAELADAPKFGAKLQKIYETSGYPNVLDEILRANKSWGPVALGEYEQARINSVLGRNDAAIQLLEQCEATQSPWVVFVDVEPGFDSLRNDPRFQALKARVAGAAALPR